MKKTGMMKNNKRLFQLLICCVLLFGLAFMVQGVYAALKDTDDLVNEFGLNDLNAVIEEKFTPPTAAAPAKPGEAYQKEVLVTNQATSNLFVRVLVTPEILSKENQLLSGMIGKELMVDLNENWKLGEDGYFYYLKKVLPKTSTMPVFTSVTIANDLDERYKDAALSIHIKSETILSAANHYRAAWWNSSQPIETELAVIDQILAQESDK